MTQEDEWHASLIVLGRGQSDGARPDLFEPEVRRTVRYADPAAWVTAAAVAQALAPIQDCLAAVRNHVGVIVISNDGPGETMENVAEAATAGFSSPLRYPAANPGSLAGVTCIAHGFRGPTLNFVMPLTRGVEPGLLMANAWLGRRIVSCVALAACGRGSSGDLLGRCLLLSAADSPPAPGIRLVDQDIAWLTGNPAPTPPVLR